MLNDDNSEPYWLDDWLVTIRLRSVSVMGMLRQESLPHGRLRPAPHISPKPTSGQLGRSLGFAQASCLTTHSDAAALFLDEMEQALPNPDNSRLLVIRSESAASTRAHDMF